MTGGKLALVAGHGTVRAMALILVLALAGLVWRGQLWALALAPFGVLAQIGNEYLLHRHVFHMAPPRRQWAFDLMWIAHYGHHDFPTQPRLWFAPGFVVFPVLVLNFAALWGVLTLAGAPAAVDIALSVVAIGGVAAFIGYEWFHVAAHSAGAKGAINRRLTTHHNQHHFRDFSRWFHVTPLGEIIDRAMGTAISREALRDSQRIEFITTLGLAPDDPRLLAARARLGPRYGLTPAEIARAARSRAG